MPPGARLWKYLLSIPENWASRIAHYIPDGFDLQPYQTIAVDIKKLRDSKQPDGQGHLIPSDATQGQLVWMQQTPYTVIGRAEGTNVAAGTSRSFSCITGCCNYFWSDFSLSPDPMDGLVGDGGQFSATNIGTDCFDNGFIWYNVQAKATSWTTTNAAVATVSTSGYGYCAGRGLATVTGNFNDKNYYMKPPLYSQCVYNAVIYPAPAPVNVNPPDHVIVINDINGPPGICPTKPWVRQATVQLADVNNVPVQTNYTTSEGYVPTAPTDSCPPYHSPIASGCGVTTTGYCPTCTGAWTDQQDVAGSTVAAICGTTIPQTPTCGFALTSTWYMCGSSGLTNPVWASSRGTYSDRIYLSGSLTIFPPGTVFH